MWEHPTNAKLKLEMIHNKTSCVKVMIKLQTRQLRVANIPWGTDDNN